MPVLNAGFTGLLNRCRRFTVVDRSAPTSLPTVPTLTTKLPWRLQEALTAGLESGVSEFVFRDDADGRAGAAEWAQLGRFEALLARPGGAVVDADGESVSGKGPAAEGPAEGPAAEGPAAVCSGRVQWQRVQRRRVQQQRVQQQRVQRQRVQQQRVQRQCAAAESSGKGSSRGSSSRGSSGRGASRVWCGEYAVGVGPQAPV
eukprot:358007-Chlamydomonas_euryale.AAC.10